MVSKEVRWILLVLLLLIALPFSTAYTGESLSYNVTISAIGILGFEKTSAPNISVEFWMHPLPPKNGSSATYNIRPGLPRLLGPVAFGAVFSPTVPTPETLVNCTGINIFSFLDMPKQYYRYTSTGGISTGWSENSTLDCIAEGCVGGENLTCHFKVDDSHLNSTETTATVRVDYKPIIQYINLAPLTAYTNNTFNCSAYATDQDNDTLTYYYQFADQGAALQDYGSNNIFDCNAITGCDKHDNITCNIIVDDSYINVTGSSNTVEILNTLPKLTGISINATLLKYGDNISVNTSGAYDEDNDTYRLECGENLTIDAKKLEPDNGMVLLMHFDNLSEYGENDTFVKDWSNKENNGSCNMSASSCPTWNSSGKLAGAYQFDGVNDYFSLGPATNLLSNVSSATVSAWVMPASVEGNYTEKIILEITLGTSNYSRFQFSINEDKKFAIAGRSNETESIQSVYSTATITAETLYHLVGIIDYANDSIQIYIDGILQSTNGTPTFSQNYTSAGSPMTVNVGADGNFANEKFYNGTIDEVAVWNRSLSESEVKELDYVHATSNLCNGTYGFYERDCGFLAPWNDYVDELNKTIYCSLYDGEHYSALYFNKTLTIDNKPPTINLISPANDTEWNISKKIIYEFNTSDAHNITSCNLILNGSIVDTKTGITKDATINFTYTTGLGEYIWSINCTDEVGNVGQSENWEVTQNYDERFFLTNIGATGFEETNPNYTYSEIIIANIVIPPTATDCRISNDNLTWTNWSACERAMYWAVSEGDGNKTVYAQINHTGVDEGLVTEYKDWIILEQIGTHLDITPPQAFSVYDDGMFANSNTSYHTRWDRPIDPETEILNGNFIYSYILSDTNGTYVTGWNATTGTEITIEGITLIEAHNYTLIVNATNPAGLTTQSTSDGIVIDITNPSISGVSSTPEANLWANANDIFFNWTASDSLSGVESYSMILDTTADTETDELTEEGYESNRTYTGKSDAEYYFHIKPKDFAGNFGETYHYGPVRIDSTPPPTPTATAPISYAEDSSIMFYWQQSTDASSGLSNYTVEIYDLNDTLNPASATTNNTYYNFTTAVVGHNYYIVIIAFDIAGNNASSETPGALPIQIISARPDGVVKIKNDPILRVETDKLGICRQDFTNKAFAFTNSTYHETVLMQGNGAYTITITCEDSDGYSDTATISYTVSKSETVGSVSVSGISPSYSGKTVSIPVSAGGVGQLAKNEFKVYINDTLTDDFIIIDENDAGNYTIKITAKAPGSYEVNVEAGGINSSKEPVTITGLTLNVQYAAVNSPQNQTRITYSDVGGKKAGLASDSSSVTIQSGAVDLKIDASADGKAYVFLTRGSVNVDNKNTMLENKQFDDYTNSFGYAQTKEYIIDTRVGYKSILLEGLTELSPGAYTLFLKNEGLGRQNKTILRIELQ